jgi:hypothetical protein
MLYIYLACILFAVSTILYNAPRVNAGKQNIDLDAVLQNSIEAQVLAETTQEMVEVSYMDKSTRYRQTPARMAQQETQVLGGTIHGRVQISYIDKSTHYRQTPSQRAQQETLALSKTKQERVELYCIDQSTRYRQTHAQRQTPAQKVQQVAAVRRSEWLLHLQLCNQLSRLSIHKQVRWADEEEDLVDDPANSDLWSLTEVDDLM